MMNYLFIVKQLLNNMFLFISFLFIWGQFFRNKKYLLTPMAPIKVRVLCGIIGGVLGGLLMSFIMRDQNFLPIDFRNFAIVISAINGGYLSSFITGLLLSCFSIISLGVNYESLIISVTMLTISIGCGFVSKKNIQKINQWIYMISYSLILQYTFMLIFPSPMAAGGQRFYKNFVIYSFLTIMFGFVVYYLSEYINQSNLMFMKYKEDSSKDFLTGLNNVREFDSLFNNLSRKAVEKKKSLSLMIIDIDWFKKINDTYGHSSGDEVLKQLGEVLKRNCRTFDIVSRNGGEEFSILLINCPSAESIEIAERIRRAVEKYEFMLPTGGKVNISVSVGVATYPNIVGNTGKLRESADIALYEAKRTGRNKVVQYY
ncbi:GGDEF domain-containing protein [Clostridium sp. P21]|uniref:GGDEF domain-containing protein n=1 Tax=Clostridium muellerianum TaxID=2716538 RepID=A0A7Y0EIC0_9CLOT|nr:GGDEF domain-containing protein [Clostridium muellerianum]NMM64001.1 GGDEF domain-containing protein [Clostridium muellerianum]